MFVENTRTDILDGIEAELRDTPERLDFTTVKREKDGEIWKVYVDLTNINSSGLDESLEGAAAWWLGPPKGGADVLSVIPEDEQINLRFANCSPPANGEKICIYPPRYLESLYECWDNKAWAEQCLSWLQRMGSSNSYDKNQVPTTEPFKWLRRRQSDAFTLLGWDVSFLWGPPGTGKTTTLGAMLAQHLVEFPTSKVLLLSTTNLAIDQALVAVDKAMEQLCQSSAAAKAVRKRCFRVGSHFIASQYKGREHLLPVQDPKLISQLAVLEAQRPDPAKVQEYARWKEEVEQLRAEIRKQATRVLDEARLAAMTTTRAVFTFEELYKRKPYDLIVFDEASQVGLAHALVVAPLAKRCLFAGDPEQLAPIVRSQNSSATRWLGQSMFSRMKKSHASTCLLNEQSRMAEPICKIVSNIFYDGKLLVAVDAKRDPKWKRDRELAHAKFVGRKTIHLELIDKNGTWSQKYRGPIRYDSVVFIRDLVGNLKTHLPENEIIVLTPFRAQRTLIRMFLQNAGCKRVKVSTVHRAQGSECHTVIFDPALGNTPFLQTEDAPRLINVALSRAKARLVIILSPDDRVNPLFNRLSGVIENMDRFSEALPISQFALQPDFPYCAVNKAVQIGDKIGRITEVGANGAKFVLMEFKSGQKKTFDTSCVVKNCS